MKSCLQLRVVKVRLDENDAPGHPRSRVICARCGEGVNDGREVKSQEGSSALPPLRVSRLPRKNSSPTRLMTC